MPRPLGEITMALRTAAQLGPGTVHEICLRAQVHPSVGRYTASRMLDRGQLVALSASRPLVVVAADVAGDYGAPVSAAPRALDRRHLERAAAQALESLEAALFGRSTGGSMP